MKQVLIRRGTPIVVDVPAPQLTDNTVLVEVRSSIISTGTELAGLASSPKSIVREAIHDPSKVARGIRMIKDKGLQRTFALVNTEMDAAAPTGYSCAGIVIGCGKNVRSISTGQRVACAGSRYAHHAEVIAVPQNLVVPVPEACDIESAASATLGAIAMQGVRRADVRFGEIVAVVGLGLIGQLTVQLLNAAGCQTIGIDVDTRRVDLARTLGLKSGIHSQENNAILNVLELTHGAGADAVIITASSQTPGLIQEAMEMVRKKGRVVIVGAVPLEFDRTPFYEKEADLLISSSYGPGRYDAEYEERGLDYPYAYVRWTENRNMSEYLRLLAERKVDFKSLIEKTWPIASAAEAYVDLKENKRMAVVLTFPEGSVETKLRSQVEVTAVPKTVSGRIRVGIIGAGSFVRAVHLPNLKQLDAQYSVAAIASRTGSTAWNAARKHEARYASTTAENIFKDPEIDLVMIGSRHDTHAGYASEAARNGKAVFLEKPAAVNQQELDALLKTIRTSGVPFMVGFNRRFSPFIGNTKALLDDRTTPAMITYRMNAGALPMDSWIQGPEGGGRIIGEACHIFDLFNYLLGAAPTEIVAMPLQPSAPNIAKTDNFCASLRYPEGSLCTLVYTSLGSTELGKELMEVFFDGKTIVMDDYRRLQFYGISKKPLTKSQQDKGHLEELRQWANYLSGKSPAPMSLDEIEAATRTSFLVDELVRSDGTN